MVRTDLRVCFRGQVDGRAIRRYERRMRTNDKMLTVATPGQTIDRIDALAAKHGLTRSEVVRRFLEAGLEANPLTDSEVQKLRSARSRRGAGLVIPMAPVASAVPAADVTGTADEVEKMGVEPRALITRGLALKLAA